MSNDIYSIILKIIMEQQREFIAIVNADNVMGLNVNSQDIIDYLEFNSSSELLTNNIIGNILITEGDIITTLKIIHDLVDYHGNYVLYINGDNKGTISYLVTIANRIYDEYGIDVHITIDYDDNYNNYLNKQVNIIGSSNFVNTAYQDFKEYQLIVV